MMFKPKLIDTLKNYNKDQFFKDMIAGIIVGVVALPLAIAFAIASGVSPEKGIFTTIIAGLIISALGGSRVQIGGPTGAFIVVVFGIVQQFGISGLIVATFIAGILLIIMGITKLSNAIKNIPYPLIIWFNTGISVIILLSAVVADGMIGGNHRSNTELIAQGIANICSSIFGGIPATGAIARTATNIKNGGRTPIAGIIHALTLLVIMLFVGKWAALIPM